MRVLDLAGYWEFALEREENPPGQDGFAATIRLPGTMDEAGFGDPVTEKSAWHLNRKVEYTGAAFYRRKIFIPSGWAGRPLELFLERCHWQTSVWIDGQYVGMRDSLCVPHRYELEASLSEGVHTLLVRVDNSMKVDVGLLADSITDHTQTNWNGIIGRMELRALPPVAIGGVRVVPDAAARRAEVKVAVKNPSGSRRRVHVDVRICGTEETETARVSEEYELDSAEADIVLACELGPGAGLWDEFSQPLYTVEVRLNTVDGPDRCEDFRKAEFGLRELRGGPGGFSINGRPMFLRGTLDCCVFPLTGYPSMTVDDWLVRLGAYKAYGLNHVRFHSWCPPEAAFEAGDRLGMMFQVESPVWTCLGEKADVDEFVIQETLRILEEYGNHPSFCMMSAGNEPSGANKEAFLTGLLDLWKQNDSCRLFTGSSGWPELATNDYHVLKNRPAALRCQDWAEEMNGRLNRAPYETESDYRGLIEGSAAPVVSHEVGQWCAFPDFGEIKRYTGVLNAGNLEIFRNLLHQKGLGEYAQRFLRASGRLQLAEYKEDIEAALRTPGFGGFQLLGLTDFSGQGTALVGVLNAFNESKGYTDADEFRSFCCETVPLARLKRAVYVQGETLEAGIGAANFGPTEIKGAVVSWSLETEDGRKAAHGTLTPENIPYGAGLDLGRISVSLQDIPAPQRLVFRIGIEGTTYANQWKIWLLEKEPEICMDGIVLSHTLEKTADALHNGKKVLFMPLAELFPNNGMPSGFTTVFWNYEFTAHQAPRTLGILCDPAHMCLARFPTCEHSGWQWFDLLRNSKFMVLDKSRVPVEPIVRVIDDWNTSDSLGTLFEARVGRGSLMVCSMDLESDIVSRPAAAQMLASITAYMQGPDFHPVREMTVEDIRSILLAQEDRKTKLFDYRELVHVD